MTLYLDSTDSQKTIIKINDKEFVRHIASPKDQDVFGFLKSTFENEGLRIQDVTEVEVNLGPGSFTGTRVGVSIANAIAFALSVPVNNQKPPVSPIYSSPPNITLPKEKK